MVMGNTEQEHVKISHEDSRKKHTESTEHFICLETVYHNEMNMLRNSSSSL